MSSDTDDPDHLAMIYPEFVKRAMHSQEPVVETRSVGDSERRVYSAVQYDHEREACWRVDIDHDPRTDGSPSVGFARCRPTAEHESIQRWTDLATGRLGGPQRLPAWEGLFTVFNAALRHYYQETSQ